MWFRNVVQSDSKFVFYIQPGVLFPNAATQYSHMDFDFFNPKKVSNIFHHLKVGLP